MGFFGWLLVIGVVIVIAAVIAFVIRMRSDEEMVSGGSMGTQLEHEDTGWGPTSTPSGHAHEEPQEER